MTRNSCFGLLAVLAVASVAQSAVTISGNRLVDGIDTPGLAGFKTYTLVATSDVAGEGIQGIDFAGDASNDPATGKGFFGPLNQVNPFGSPTIYTDANNAIVGTGGNVLHDSQFMVNSQQVIVPAGFSEEGPNILQGIWSWDAPVGQSIAFAQLVIPTAQTAVVQARGSFAVVRGGTPTDLDAITFEVGGGIQNIPPVVADIGPATVGEDAVADVLGEVLNLEPVDTAPGTPPIVWALVGAPTYTPGFGALPGAPGLGSATFSINSTTGAFQFNTLGSTRGTYVFSGSATGPGGTDTFTLTTEVRVVPEPATLSLLGLALVGFVGFARKRS